MLFKDEKREQVKLKAKPGIIELAEKVYATAYPFSSEANVDDLFEEMVTRFALQLGLIGNQAPVPMQSVEEPVVEEVEIENGDTIEVGSLLKG